MQGLRSVKLFDASLHPDRVKAIVDLLRIEPGDDEALDRFYRRSSRISVDTVKEGCELQVAIEVIHYVTQVMWRLEQFGIYTIPPQNMSFTSVSAELRTRQRKDINPSRFFESHEAYHGNLLRSDLPLMESHQNGHARVVVIPIHSILTEDESLQARAEAGGHWSLLVYYAGSNNNNKLYHYDSIPGMHRSRVEDLLEIYNRPNVMATEAHGGSPPLFTSRRTLVFAEDVIEPAKVPRQPGSWECGIYVLFIMRAIQERAKIGIYEPLVLSADMELLVLNDDDDADAVRRRISAFRKSIALNMELDARFSTQVQELIIADERPRQGCQALGGPLEDLMAVMDRRSVSPRLLQHLLLRMASSKMFYSHKMSKDSLKNVHCQVHAGGGGGDRSLETFRRSTAVMNIMFLQRGDGWTAVLVKHASQHYFLYDPTGGYLAAEDSSSASRDEAIERERRLLGVESLNVLDPAIQMSQRNLIPATLGRTRVRPAFVSQLASLALAIRIVNSGMPMSSTTFWGSFLDSVFSQDGVSHGASLVFVLSRRIIDVLVHGEVLLRHSPAYLYKRGAGSDQWLALTHTIPAEHQIQTRHTQDEWSVTADSELLVVPLAALLYRFQSAYEGDSSVCLGQEGVSRRRIAAINTDLFPYNRFTPEQFQGDAHVLNWLDWQREQIFLEESAANEIPYWFIPKVAVAKRGDFTTPESLAAIGVSAASIVRMLHPDPTKATYLPEAVTATLNLDALFSQWGYVDVTQKWLEHFTRGPLHWMREEERVRMLILNHIGKLRTTEKQQGHSMMMIQKIIQLLTHTPHWFVARNMSMLDFRHGDTFDQEVTRIVENLTADGTMNLNDIFVKDIVLFPMLLTHHYAGSSAAQQYDEPYGQLPSDAVALFNPMSLVHARVLAQSTVVVSEDVDASNGWFSRISSPFRPDWIQHAIVSPIYNALWAAPQGQEVSSDEFRLLTLYINEALRHLLLKEGRPLDRSLEKELSGPRNFISVNSLYKVAASYGL